MSGAQEPSDWLGAFCSRIHGVVVGEAAGEASAEGGGAVTVLPTWLYLDTPLEDKEASFEFLTPIRLLWDCPQVVVHDSDVVCRWRTNSVGVVLEGETVLRVGQGEGRPPFLTAVPETITSPHLSEGVASEVLLDLASEGEVARWEALALIEPVALMELRQVERAVSAEVHNIDPGSTTCIPRLMDDVALEGLRDELVLEAGRNTGTSAAQRLVHNSTLPQTFVNVEPGGYLKRNIRRDAETIVRRHIQDPKAGVRIRRLARLLGTTHPDTLLAACLERYPKLRISLDAVGRALDVGPDTSAQSQTLLDEWGYQQVQGRKLP